MSFFFLKRFPQTVRIINHPHMKFCTFFIQIFEIKIPAKNVLTNYLHACSCTFYLIAMINFAQHHSLPALQIDPSTLETLDFLHVHKFKRIKQADDRISNTLDLKKKPVLLRRKLRFQFYPENGLFCLLHVPTLPINTINVNMKRFTLWSVCIISYLYLQQPCQTEAASHKQ